ncbi:MAG: glycosyltransferase family 87 protein [Polyangiaceae bacterium]
MSIAVFSIAVGIVVFAASFGLTGSSVLSIVLAAISVAVAVALFRRYPPLRGGDVSLPRPLAILSRVATLVAVAQVVRLAVFVAEPAWREFSNAPSSEWEVHHCCLTAYYVAASAAGTDRNIYDDSLYQLPGADPKAPLTPRSIGPFKVDMFEYPPPFLLLPRGLARLTSDFLRYRALGFALHVAVVFGSIAAVARFLEGATAPRALVLSSLVWAAYPTLSLLQKGNAQGIIVAIAMLAMVLFERRHEPIGGALLAYATLSKLFPGLLILYLLLQRRWRAAAWTGGWCVILSVLTLVDVGSSPFLAFLDHLPGLLGGESFPALRRAPGLAVNFSIPGLVFKARLFGVTDSLFFASKIVGWLYTLFLVAVTVAVARRPTRHDEKPIVWMALLVFAMLRSPFLPQSYAAFPPLWLLTLMAAVWVKDARAALYAVVAWLALGVYWPQDWQVDPRILAGFNLVPQLATVLVAAIALLRVYRAEVRIAPELALGKAADAAP